MAYLQSCAAFPVIDLKETGKNIQRLRVENGMSVREMQEIFGFSTPQSIYKWQWGQTLPDISNLLMMSKIFGVPVEKILVLEH